MTLPARTFNIMPALHLSGGRLIDHARNEASATPVLDRTDPLEAAQRCVEAGAAWLHVVNVDATFERDASHPWALIEALCALPVKVQYAGGMRSREDIDRAIACGVSRLLLSTAAVESPELVAEAIVAHGRERFGLSILTDTAGDVVTHGWQAVGGLQALTIAVQMSQLGMDTLVHSRLQPDGTMTGTDSQSSTELAELSGMNVIVGGEIRDLSDVVACYNRPGITGVLIGKALQTGAIRLSDALEETRASLAFESGMPLWKADQKRLPIRLRRRLAQHYLRRHAPSVSGLRVLDAGGGNGLASLPLAQDGAEVHVVDRSHSMLEDLHANAAAAELTHLVHGHALDIREIPGHFDAGYFDLVLAHNVIQYSPDWAHLLVAMLDRLDSGGLLSLMVRNWHAEPYRIDPQAHTVEELPALLERTRGPSRVFDADVLLFSADYLCTWLREHGVDPLADYGLLCRNDDPPAAEGVVAEETVLDKLFALESVMGERATHKIAARYVQIVARKR